MRMKEGTAALLDGGEEWLEVTETLRNMSQLRNCFEEEYAPEKEVKAFVRSIVTVTQHAIDHSPGDVPYELLFCHQLEALHHIYSKVKDESKLRIVKSCVELLAENFICRSLSTVNLDSTVRLFSIHYYWSPLKLASRILYITFKKSDHKIVLMQSILEYLREERHGTNNIATIFTAILKSFKWKKYSPELRCILVDVCWVLSENMETEVMSKMRECILHLAEVIPSPGYPVWVMLVLARESCRKTLGDGRSELADMLYTVSSIYMGKKYGGLVVPPEPELFYTLLMMMQDEDCDVAVRGYQTIRNMVGLDVPRCTWQSLHLFVKKLAPIDMPEGIRLLLANHHFEILQRLLQTYIDHSQYPLTLEAAFNLHCILLISYTTAQMARINVNMAIYLQNAVLMHVPHGSKRQNFLLCLISCLLKLVASIYEIPALAQLTERVEEIRSIHASYLLCPVRASPFNTPPVLDLLYDVVQVQCIIDSWYQEKFGQADDFSLMYHFTKTMLLRRKVFLESLYPNNMYTLEDMRKGSQIDEDEEDCSGEQENKEVPHIIVRHVDMKLEESTESKTSASSTNDNLVK